MKKPVKPYTKTKGKRKKAAVKFRAYSNEWWLSRSSKYNENPNHYMLYSKWNSLIINSMPTYEGRKRVRIKTIKKLMELKEKNKPKEIMQIAAAFVNRGLDDEIIHCLKKAGLYSFAGHVSLARNDLRSALAWYEMAQDNQGIKRVKQLLKK